MNSSKASGSTERSFRQFEALFDHATIGILVTDEAGRIINFNHYAEDQFGYKKEEIIGNYVEALLPSKSQNAHVKYRQGYVANPTPRRMGEGRDLYAKRKDETVFPVEISLSHYVDNGALFFIAFIIDITVRKNNEMITLQQRDELERITNELKLLNTDLEQKVEDRTKILREILAELEQSKAELSEALENEKEVSDLKSKFVTMASHEFRTPLSTILSSAYLLEQYNGNDQSGKSLKHIQRIKNAVAGMKSILEDFLSLGKLEEGLIQTHPEQLSAASCIEEITAVISEFEAILKPGQRIEFQHTGSADVTVDKHLLKNILINLISNAIKFSPEKAIIYVRCLFDPAEMKLTVKDSGIGIPEEDQQYLFKRFFRGRNASNIQGTGLGLHIVGKYLELMNGKIDMVSNVNEGTAFTIYLPQSNQ
jgi:PAS domain S-box-containing protein